MNCLHPVFTERTECQDCYKCVRECPVKAIRVAGASAEVLPDECILCGHCVDVCAAQAKKIRDDLPRVRRLVAQRRVIVSLAPSWPAAFPGTEPRALIAALRRLGFAAVSETALGAQEVSAHVARLLADGTSRLHVSSACPTAVEYLRRRFPDLVPCITPLLSPLLAHATLLQRAFGPQTTVVFIGPCIAKKLEADAHPGLVAAALTFTELRTWLQRDGIALAGGDDDDAFVPAAAEEGALYPVDGGMLAGIRANLRPDETCAAMAFSGLEAISMALRGYAAQPPREPVFLELLACAGGCCNGPALRAQAVLAPARQALERRVNWQGAYRGRQPQATIAAAVAAPPPPAPLPAEAELAEVLRGIGKHSERDELNCSGCGYDTCRDFCRGLLAGKAEKAMCVSYMRKLAHRKAHALMQAMPSGIAIVDRELRLVESNRRFAQLLGSAEQYDHAGGLDGAHLARLAPFAPWCAEVLAGAPGITARQLRHAGAVLSVSVFVIEPRYLAGIVVQDVTEPAVRKEEIVSAAQAVIRRNLETVQQIACLLGENAAESEMLLQSVVESFGAEARP